MAISANASLKLNEYVFIFFGNKVLFQITFCWRLHHFAGIAELAAVAGTNQRSDIRLYFTPAVRAFSGKRDVCFIKPINTDRKFKLVMSYDNKCALNVIFIREFRYLKRYRFTVHNSRSIVDRFAAVQEHADGSSSDAYSRAAFYK